MDQPTPDALLEEIRNLRRDVSRLHRTVAAGVIGFVIVVFAIAAEVRWFGKSLIGASIGAGIVFLGWVFYQGRNALAEARKNRPPARLVVTPTPPKS